MNTAVRLPLYTVGMIARAGKLNQIKKESSIASMHQKGRSESSHTER